jgi:uncharacterized membrane protein
LAVVFLAVVFLAAVFLAAVLLLLLAIVNISQSYSKNRPPRGRYRLSPRIASCG